MFLVSTSSVLCCNFTTPFGGGHHIPPAREKNFSPVFLLHKNHLALCPISSFYREMLKLYSVPGWSRVLGILLVGPQLFAFGWLLLRG